LLDYSIVIPVFNKAELTRNCLATLQPTLSGAGQGEVIVVDNASTDETAEMLRAFPWVRVIRNERNLGFAGANNQGARIASGEALVLLNNDTQGLPGWLAAMLRCLREPGTGAVGARLLFADNTIQHAGVAVAGVLFGRTEFAPYHYAHKHPGNEPDVAFRREYQIVTGACLATPRDLYLRLGGLDETYWNGYEDVDYCLKVRAQGLKVIYEPAATLYHFESQSGVQRFRKLFWNLRALAERWSGKVAFDSAARFVENGQLPALRRDSRSAVTTVLTPTPPTSILVHGELPEALRARFESMLRANRSPVESIAWCPPERAPAEVRERMRVRGERFLALIDARAGLEPGWLDEMIAQSATPPNVAAVTFAPELPLGQNVATLAADARCTLLCLKQFPQHVDIGDFDTLGGAVADLLLRMVELERGTRGVSRSLGSLPEVGDDASFARAHGRALREVLATGPEAIERILRARPKWQRGLVSIVTLSWNAPVFTQKALESIRACTSEPYEVIVVDNGSGAETTSMLRAIDDPHVRVIYNAENRGFSGGNNDGLAVARGDHVVFLNNDVIVTDGWLDGLLDPFARMPGIGVTAPRSNMVVGHQQLPDVKYDSETAMAAFAAKRREEFGECGYFADRAIGLCLCVSRTVLDQIGGFDERFALGNFEDDDFCLRVRAAGYTIFVCDDVFIHHFGSRSFAANHVDYRQALDENWRKFAEKWGYPPEFPSNGYLPQQAFTKGFDRRVHYATFERSPAASAAAGARADYLQRVQLVFCARVEEERDWMQVAEFAGRYIRTFEADDGTLLAISVHGRLTADAIRLRIERAFRRAGVDPERGGCIEISDGEDALAWRERFAGKRVVEVMSLRDRSPSALRRLLAELPAQAGASA
jgi:GT2 family glycosyltransferase